MPKDGKGYGNMHPGMLPQSEVGHKADMNSNVGQHSVSNDGMQKSDAGGGQVAPLKSVANSGGVVPSKNSVPMPGIGGSLEGGPDKI